LKAIQLVEGEVLCNSRPMIWLLYWYDFVLKGLWGLKVIKTLMLAYLCGTYS
jgi:hypothetical protein